MLARLSGLVHAIHSGSLIIRNLILFSCYAEMLAKIKVFIDQESAMNNIPRQMKKELHVALLHWYELICLRFRSSPFMY